MAISVVMPALEMAQETGKLISWLKKAGDAVIKGEALLEVETDKAVMEVESPADGVLAGIKVQPGTEVPVGRIIAWILRPGEVVPADEVPVETARKRTASPSGLEGRLTVVPVLPSVRDVRISPKARRLAAERGVDLSQVRGSGSDGEIVASDILAAAERSPAPSTAEASSISKLMAERTTQSWTSVPHFFVVRDVEADALIAQYKKLLPAIEQSRGVRLTYTDLLVALVARVLAKQPRVNASWVGGAVQVNVDVNVGVAMATSDGVVAPVIHNADKADLGEIAVRRHELTNRTRAGKLRPSDIAGGTFTISNLGMFGVDAFTAVILPPQAAILAVGRIADRVVVVDGRPGIRPMMTLTLSSDHRVIDGVRAAEFLRDVSAVINDPQQCLG